MRPPVARTAQALARRSPPPVPSVVDEASSHCSALGAAGNASRNSPHGRPHRHEWRRCSSGLGAQLDVAGGRKDRRRNMRVMAFAAVAITLFRLRFEG
jgi:hypothetical protein